MHNIANNFKKLLKREDLFNRASSVQETQLQSLLGTNVYKVIEFYTNYQPYNMPMLSSYVQLIDIDNIITENMNAEPGKYLAQYGVYVFAITVGGNVICVDTNETKDGDPAVLIADSNFCSYNAFYDCIEIGVVPDKVIDQLGDNELLSLNYDNIKMCLNRIEDSFMEFMMKLSKDVYVDIENYL